MNASIQIETSLKEFIEFKTDASYKKIYSYLLKIARFVLFDAFKKKDTSIIEDAVSSLIEHLLGKTVNHFQKIERLSSYIYSFFKKFYLAYFASIRLVYVDSYLEYDNKETGSDDYEDLENKVLSKLESLKPDDYLSREIIIAITECFKKEKSVNNYLLSLYVMRKVQRGEKAINAKLKLMNLGLTVSSNRTIDNILKDVQGNTDANMIIQDYERQALLNYGKGLNYDREKFIIADADVTEFIPVDVRLAFVKDNLNLGTEKLLHLYMAKFKYSPASFQKDKRQVLANSVA